MNELKCEICGEIKPIKNIRNKNPMSGMIICWDCQDKENFKTRFRLTEWQFYKILELQGGECFICGRENDTHGGSLCVDHDHKTGKTRGILCHGCNTMIGLNHDSPTQFEMLYAKKGRPKYLRAALYLTEYQKTIDKILGEQPKTTKEGTINIIATYIYNLCIFLGFRRLYYNSDLNKMAFVRSRFLSLVAENSPQETFRIICRDFNENMDSEKGSERIFLEDCVSFNKADCEQMIENIDNSVEIK